MSRKVPGFTLLELMLVVVIIGLLGALVVTYGRSARQAGDLASAAWELSLRASALRPRAMVANRDFVLMVVDAVDPTACQYDQQRCGRVLVFSNPTPAFAISGFDPDAAFTSVEYEEELRLPRNSQLDTTSSWTAPPPFSSVSAMDGGIVATCGGGRRCFAIRYRVDGTVEPVPAGGGTLTPTRAGFAMLLRPVEQPSGAAERRAIFVSFPAGIVKTAVF